MIPCFLCRCEDVLAAEVDHAIDLGWTTVEEIKRYTGLGTGPCQGKECLPLLAAHLAARDADAACALTPFTQRPPAEPAPLAALAGTSEDPTR